MIKEAIFTQDLLEEIVGKRPQGPDSKNRFMGLCPFHGEARESLRIFGDTGGFMCFGCFVKGGDVIDFWGAAREIEPKEAIRELADRVGSSSTGDRLRVKRKPRAAKDIPRAPEAQVIPKERIPIAGDLLELQRPGQKSFMFMPTNVHIYKDEQDRATSLILRKDDRTKGTKDFCPVRWDGFGWWAVAQDKPRSLYGLEQIAKAKQVLIVEGEKAADAARVRLPRWMVVVTWPGGGNAVGATDFTPLKGKKVILWPDNDEPGANAMDVVGSVLAGVANEIKIVDVARGTLSPKGDAADLPEEIEMITWMSEGITVWSQPGPEPMRELAPEPPSAVHHETRGQLSADDQDDVLIVVFNEHADVAEELVASKLIARFVGSSPTLFRHQGSVVEVGALSGDPVILPVKKYRARVICHDVAIFMRQTDRSGRVNGVPPMDFYLTVLERLRDLLPELRGITQAPIIRLDGSIFLSEGFDARSGLYHVPSPDLELTPLYPNPTQTDVAEACASLEYVFKDFPFNDESSRTHILMALFTITLRHLIDGPVPGFALTAPTPGTGKTKLIEIICLILFGSPPALLELPYREEEISKTIASKILDGSSLLAFDNVSRKIGGSALAMLLTAQKWESRALGGNTMIRGANRLVVLFTGNNIDASKEATRRLIVSQLDADRPNPEERDDFSESDLNGFVLKNRSLLLHAVLTISAAALQAKSKPEGIPILGSYRSWCEMMGWVIGVTGWPGLLGNLDEIRSSVNQESAQWAATLELFFAKGGCRDPFTMKELRGKLEPGGDLHDHVGDLPGTLRSAIRGQGDFGKRFQKRKRRPETLPDGSVIVLEKHDNGSGGVARWVIQKTFPETRHD